MNLPRRRSAELHSAVSQNCILRTADNLEESGRADALPNANRRYGPARRSRNQRTAACLKPQRLGRSDATVNSNGDLTNARAADWDSPRSEKFAQPATIFAAASVLAALLFLQLGCKDRNSAAPNRTTEQAPTPPRAEFAPLTNMVPIRAGSLIRIRQPVSISHDFWLGKYEVTQAEYAALMGKNPSHFLGDSNRPVEKLSFYDAAAYCAALTTRERTAGRLPPGYEYRLPSEAEWEYACRAGTTNRFSFGDDPKAADAFAWTLENSETSTHPVGLKQPNPWGLYDMHGNVWEWCIDWFAPYPETPAVDPMGPATGKYKVFRGGGWNQEVEFARSANRFMMSPSNGIYFVGFRVALGHTAPGTGR